jgi:hypothetical protein
MSTPWESPILRVNGYLNTANDDVIAGGTSIGTRSRYAGQLGKHVFYDSSQISTMFLASVGTLYAGRYRYVRVRATDDSSPAMTPGRLCFWDTTVTNWRTKYQVTRDENLSSVDNAVMLAGVFIGNIEPGNYGFICDWGVVDVRYRTVLTTAAAIGNRVYATGAGDTGFDQGTVDTITTDATSLPNSRYLGVAIELPVAAGLKPIFLSEIRNYLP